jgi:hypothetical protein
MLSVCSEEKRRTEMKVKTILLVIGLSLTFYGRVSAQQSTPAPGHITKARYEKYFRTELYMGMSIPGGAIVSEDDWDRFLNDVVTPLFPDGFTVLNGRGQYREASGKIAKEPSHVLVFLYRKIERKTADLKIEQIRSDYKKRFSQESVLRVDIAKSILVSF